MDEPDRDAADDRRSTLVVLSPRNVWRVGLVVLGVIALGALVMFILEDGGSVLFTVLMAWFAALAMAPLVQRLSHRMPRGVATLLIMVTAAVAIVLFLLIFGRLFLDQIVQFVSGIPDFIDRVLELVNERFDTEFTRDALLSSISLSSEDFAQIAADIGLNVLGVLGSILGTVFGLFTFALFAFYLSADMPRLERWIASLFPARIQDIVMTAWSVTAQKTGAYIGARVVLATISSIASGIVFAAIGLPYWLPLALWTGIVAQFVPTIGTYISIILPVLVGFTSGEPWQGVVVLIWAILYQQVENLTFEPKISARAVDVHPAVAFGAVLLGAALFGVAGAFLAVPVAAMMLALLDVYGKRYDLASGLDMTPLPPDKRRAQRRWRWSTSSKWHDADEKSD
jgi:predicted PurR-regulated permease PerM